MEEKTQSNPQMLLLAQTVARNKDRLFPLQRLRLGFWESTLHQPDQLFLLVPKEPKRQLVFFAVLPPREASSSKHDRDKFIEHLLNLPLEWYKNKAFLLNVFGNRHPFAQQVDEIVPSPQSPTLSRKRSDSFGSRDASPKKREISKNSDLKGSDQIQNQTIGNPNKPDSQIKNKKESTSVSSNIDDKSGSKNLTVKRKYTDFFGVVAFELDIDQIGGLHADNSLIKGFSRLVFEAKQVKKLTFERVQNLFKYYDLNSKNQDSSLNKQTEDLLSKRGPQLFQNQALNKNGRDDFYEPQHDDSGKSIKITTPFGQFYQQEQIIGKKLPAVPKLTSTPKSQIVQLSARGNQSAVKNHSSANFLRIVEPEKFKDERANDKDNSHDNIKRQRSKSMEKLPKQTRKQHQNNQQGVQKLPQATIRKDFGERPIINIESVEESNMDDLLSNSQSSNMIFKGLQLDQKLVNASNESVHSKESVHSPTFGTNHLDTVILYKQITTQELQQAEPKSPEAIFEQYDFKETLSNKRASQHQNQQHDVKTESDEGKPLTESIISCVTIIAHHEDPGVQLIFKQLIQEPSNKPLLLLYEQGLPSWTIVLAQYTGYYKPWWRKVVRIVTFLAQCITMSIGFYDLYKNMPIMNSFLNDYFANQSEWLKELVYVRITVVMGWLVYFTIPFQTLFNFFIAESVFLSIAGQIIQCLWYPVWLIIECLWYPVWLFKSLVYILIEIIWPIVALLGFFINSIYFSIITLLTAPFQLVTIVFQSLYCGLFSIGLMIKSFVEGLQGFLSIFKPVTQQESRQATLTTLQVLTNLAMVWSQSMTNKLIKAIKAVYDFVIYVCCEIGKHNFTIQKALWDKLTLAKEYKDEHVVPEVKKEVKKRKSSITKIFNVLVIVFLIGYLLYLYFIWTREMNRLNGCVFCGEEIVDAVKRKGRQEVEYLLEKSDQFVQSQVDLGLNLREGSSSLHQSVNYFILRIFNLQDQDQHWLRTVLEFF